MCICRSLPFRHNIYGRRLFKWITQRDLLTLALVKLLVFAPLFNGQKSRLNYFALQMAAIVVVRRSLRTKRCVRRDRIFSTSMNLFGMSVEHIIVYTYSLPSHVIFILLQKIKDRLDPSTRSHAISKILATLNLLLRDGATVGDLSQNSNIKQPKLL